MRHIRVWIAFALFAIAACGAPASAASQERASIIPLVNVYLGPAVNNLPGFSLYANGISDYWATSSSATVSFAVFVFPGRAVTQDIGFVVLAPDGKTNVYTYAFKSQKIGENGNWYSIAAVGDFSKAGVYNAIVTADGQEIGRIPILFSAPAPQ